MISSSEVTEIVLGTEDNQTKQNKLPAIGAYIKRRIHII